jgi:hypothetical protein
MTPVATTPVATTPAKPPAPKTTIQVETAKPMLVRRQTYRPRHSAHQSERSSAAAEETETTNRRPPPDALDQLLAGSAL